MMESLFLSNWQHEKDGERMGDPRRLVGIGGDEVRLSKGDRGRIEEVRVPGRTGSSAGGGTGASGSGSERGIASGNGAARGVGTTRGRGGSRGTPSFKRRRMRGGGAMVIGKREAEEMCVLVLLFIFVSLFPKMM